ncbi:MAG: transcriptional regulator [Bacteroidetes bacterium 46-16]|nr:MAG: transcriptional regulator [Bacteroidetes bacterium 46-16]
MRRDVYQAIADPNRRAILNLLAEQPMNVNAIAEQFDISRPAISKHVRILTECGLLTIIQEGRERYCKTNPGRLKEVSDWVAHFSRYWDEKLNALKNYIEHEQRSTGKRSKH